MMMTITATISQARLFYQSQSDIEKDHIVSAFRFELGKVQVPDIRERMVGLIMVSILQYSISGCDVCQW